MASDRLNRHTRKVSVACCLLPVASVEDAFRLHVAQIVATLTRYLGPGNLELAEDAAQEAMIRALHQWAYRGAPDNPRGWLLTVAKNYTLDVIRRERAMRIKHGEIVRDADLLRRAGELEQAAAWLDNDLRDDQLRMMFTCCHPALSREAQVALTLKTLGGFGVAEIARAFLASERAIAQRLVRAKRTLRRSNIPFGVPDHAELPRRLDAVLAVLYLLFNEGYSAHQGDDLIRHDLCAEAIRLTSILGEHPAGDAPNTHALLALMLLQASRLATRTDADGDILLLEEQDRGQWDWRLILNGLAELNQAATGDAISVYHLQAGIAALHAVAPTYAATDWPAILDQYDGLLEIAPSGIVALNRAVALAMVAGPEEALVELERVRGLPGMESYYLFHVTAGEFHRRAGDGCRAIDSYRRAQSFTTTAPEQRFLARKLAGIEGSVRVTRDA